MRRFFAVLVVLLVTSCSWGSPVQPASPAAQSIRADQIEVFSDIRIGREPIPIFSTVQFVTINGQLTLRWDDQREFGFQTRFIRLDGVRIEYMSLLGQNAFYPGEPREGDLAIVQGYSDYTSLTLHSGVINTIALIQRAPYPVDFAWRFGVADKFSKGLSDEGLFLFSRYSGLVTPKPECMYSGEVTLNGQPLVPGPYGKTYRIEWPGGILAASFTGESCKTPVVKALVRPADSIDLSSSGSIKVTAVNKMEPALVCDILRTWRPQWQPNETLVGNIVTECGVYSLRDTRFLATLPRLGFIHGDYPLTKVMSGRGEVPYISLIDNAEALLPAHHWIEVDSVPMEYTQVGTVEQRPVAKGFETYERFSIELRSEKVWGPYLASYKWGEPVIFAHIDESFDWKKTRFYRFTQIDGGGIRIEQGVWD